MKDIISSLLSSTSFYIQKKSNQKEEPVQADAQTQTLISKIITSSKIPVWYLLTTPIMQKSSLLLNSIKKHLKINFASKIIPQSKISEDNIYQSDNGLFVLADGVGGWKSHGIDPTWYSKALCEEIPKQFHRKNTLCKSLTNFKETIIHSITNINNSGVLGSSTLCTIYVDVSTKKWFSVFLGDTQYILFRFDNHINKYSIVYKSPKQVHEFNTPYQFGHIGDDPYSCLMYECEIQVNDLVIIASDGLWDNVSDEAMLAYINGNLHGNINSIVNDIVNEAKKNSVNEMFYSPFAKRANDNGWYYYGGKPDDISAIGIKCEFEDCVNYYSEVEGIAVDDDKVSKQSRCSNNSKETVGTVCASEEVLHEDYCELDW